MKKITSDLSAFAGSFMLIILLPFLANAQQTNSGSIKLSRFIYPAAITQGSTVTVTIFLEKGYLGGLGRLDEYIPSGFKAMEADKNGSDFSVNDTVAKFAWSYMPTDPGFTVSYRLKVPAKALGNYTLSGQFTYLTSSGAATAYFKPYTITVKKASDTLAAAKPAIVAAKAKDTIIQAPVVVAPPTPINKVDTTSAKPSVVTKTIAAAPIKPEVTKPKINTPAPKVSAAKTAAPKTAPAPTTTDSKSNGLYYRVQIMASAERLDVDSVIINGIRDKLYIITNKGISRYYIGAFHELQPAVEYRKRILNNGLKGSFVCAYKDGTKITIQEALTIVRTN